MTQYLFIAFFVILTLGFSVVYFYIFAKSQERFVQYLGVCWVLYSVSLLCLMLGMSVNDMDMLSLRKYFDMANILAFVYAAYAFARKKTPSVWLRFTLYISIWLVLGLSLGFDSWSIDLITVTYQIILTIVLVTVISRYWRLADFERNMIAVIFAFWGIGKGAISILTLIEVNSPMFYAGEIMFSNVVNFLMLILFFRRTQERLSTAELTFRTVTENSSDILFLLDVENAGRLIYMAPSVKSILGVSENRFYNDNKAYQAFVHSEEWDTFERLLAGDESGESNGTIRAYDVNGQLHYMDVIVKSIRDSNGTPLREGIIRDITVQKKAEDQMISSKQSRDKLLSYVSHELKTPIASILGYSAALREDMDTSVEDRQKMLDIIYTKSITLDKLIKDLGQLSKLETNQYSFEFSLIGCYDLSYELWKRHEHDGEAKNVTIVKQLEDLEHKTLIADIDRIDQVYTNILTNGLRYSEEGSKITVRFFLDKKKENFMFSVTNYGVIISDAEKLHIFDRFYRVDAGHKSANENNSGLGLTISKEIAEAHKGSIMLESDSVNGTTFTVTIPLFDERMY